MIKAKIVDDRGAPITHVNTAHSFCLQPPKSRVAIGAWRREQGSEAWEFLVTNQHIGGEDESITLFSERDRRVAR